MCELLSIRLQTMIIAQKCQDCLSLIHCLGICFDAVIVVIAIQRDHYFYTVLCRINYMCVCVCVGEGGYW